MAYRKREWWIVTKRNLCQCHLLNFTFKLLKVIFSTQFIVFISMYIYFVWSSLFISDHCYMSMKGGGAKSTAILKTGTWTVEVFPFFQRGDLFLTCIKKESFTKMKKFKTNGKLRSVNVAVSMFANLWPILNLKEPWRGNFNWESHNENRNCISTFFR